MIIGITGTLGAGKGTIVEFLKEKGFTHYSVRDFLTEEIKKMGMPMNRDSMVFLANKLREKNSSSYIIEQLYSKAQEEKKDCIIESIRTVGEAEALRLKGDFYLIAVDAPPETRYSRVILRNSETDNVDYSTFLENEKREMFSIDSTRQNLKKCIEMADFIIQNNKDLEYLKKQIDMIYEKIKSSGPRKTELKTEEKYQRLSWDEYFIKIASLVAERSTCLRHHVGAVIVRDKRILTTGYNGAAKGKKDCLELGCNKDKLGISSGIGSEECRAIHAEQNAIIQAGIHGIILKDSTLYLTHTPCRMCAKEIVQAGIKKIISYQEFAGDKGAKEYLEESGIEIIKIPRPSNIIFSKD